MIHSALLKRASSSRMGIDIVQLLLTKNQIAHPDEH